MVTVPITNSSMEVHVVSMDWEVLDEGDSPARKQRFKGHNVHSSQ